MQCIFEQGDKTWNLLAWLSKEHSHIASIAVIRDEVGALLTDPVAINDCFARFYHMLYSSRDDYTEEDLCTYLAAIEFPTLQLELQTELDAPITLEEVQQDIYSLQSGKIPQWYIFRHTPVPVPKSFFRSQIK